MSHLMGLDMFFVLRCYKHLAPTEPDYRMSAVIAKQPLKINVNMFYSETDGAFNVVRGLGGEPFLA